MATLAQSELGETAARLLQTANGQPIPIVDGNRQVGALVSMEYIEDVRQMHRARMWEIAEKMGAKVEEHAAELGITTEALVERLLIDRDEF